nr:MAG TPA: hypothetical protein [Caudoviricetes sp.]
MRKWCNCGCWRYIQNAILQMKREQQKIYAIVKQENGQSYTSMVFGYYCPVQSRDGYDRYLESIHNQFYIVLDKCNPTG